MGRATLLLAALKAGAIALAAASALLLAAPASAQDELVTIGRTTVAPGEQGDTDLWAMNIHAPGLGAWTIDVVYNPDVVTPLSCGAQSGSVCNIDFRSNLVRVTGAKGVGLIGDVKLASITWRCDRSGATALTVGLQDFADATETDPMVINAETVEGAVYCDPRPAGPLGDVDCNGIVNAVDAQLVLQFEAALVDDLPCLENGDMNGDGEVDSVDAFLILVLIAGL